MYTDDIVGIVVSGRVALNMIIAVYLTATDKNLLLAGMHKMEIGTGLRVLIGHLHAAHQLRVLLSGSASFETYEKLVGLLVHCWILACMQEDMIDDMYKPLAHMRRSFQGGKNTLDPQSHRYQYLIPRWEQWLDVVTTCSAALGSFNEDVLYVSTTHVYGDAFRDDDPQEVHAGIGGYNEGAWWHHTVDPLDAAVLDITLVIPSPSDTMQLCGVRRQVAAMC